MIFLIILLTFGLAACNQQPTPPPPPTPTPDPLLADTAPKPVDLTAADGVTLKAVYYPPKNPNLRNPALLLLPMLNSGKEAWQEFAGAAQEAGHAVLALDLRGHGESGGTQDFGVMDRDVDVAVNWLAGRLEIAGDRIGVVGADLGANLAIRAGSRHAEVKSVALLSPGLDYKGIQTVEALSAYGQRPVIIVAAENDTYAADSARTLNSRALGQHQLQIYPGSDRGTNLLRAQAGLRPMLLAWFASTL
jgi:pimeloyl-ACP methyl ester carboxylesterase